MPAVKGLEAGETTVFFAAVGEIDLMAQPGTPDLESILRWLDFSLHSLPLIYIQGDVKILPEDGYGMSLESCVSFQRTCLICDKGFFTAWYVEDVHRQHPDS